MTDKELLQQAFRLSRMVRAQLPRVEHLKAKEQLYKTLDALEQSAKFQVEVTK